MEQQDKEKKWLSLRQASKLLGIHPVTLRIWADTGKIPFTRTAGGHRRFMEEDVLAFYENSGDRAEADDLDLKVNSALGRAHSELSRHRLESEEWYEFFDHESRERERELGQRLLKLLVQYVTVDDADVGDWDEELLNRAREVGRQMGVQKTEVGLSLVETVRAFLMFEDSAIDAVVPALSRPGRIDEHDLQARGRAKRFMREVLFTLLDTYQRGLLESA